MNIPTSVISGYGQVHLVNLLLAQMIERRVFDGDDEERLSELIARLKSSAKHLQEAQKILKGHWS